MQYWVPNSLETQTVALGSIRTQIQENAVVLVPRRPKPLGKYSSFRTMRARVRGNMTALALSGPNSLHKPYRSTRSNVLENTFHAQFGREVNLGTQCRVCGLSSIFSLDLHWMWVEGWQLTNWPRRGNSIHKWRMQFFAYSWKLPAYSGAFLLTVDNFRFFTYSWSFFAYSFSFSTYSWSVFSAKVRLIRALRDCKQRSLTVSKKAPTVSTKASPHKFSWIFLELRQRYVTQLLLLRAWF